MKKNSMNEVSVSGKKLFQNLNKDFSFNQTKSIEKEKTQETMVVKSVYENITLKR